MFKKLYFKEIDPNLSELWHRTREKPFWTARTVQGYFIATTHLILDGFEMFWINLGSSRVRKSFEPFWTVQRYFLFSGYG